MKNNTNCIRNHASYGKKVWIRKPEYIENRNQSCKSFITKTITRTSAIILILRYFITWTCHLSSSELSHYNIASAWIFRETKQLRKWKTTSFAICAITVHGWIFPFAPHDSYFTKGICALYAKMVSFLIKRVFKQRLFRIFVWHRLGIYVSHQLKVVK